MFLDNSFSNSDKWWLMNYAQNLRSTFWMVRNINLRNVQQRPEGMKLDKWYVQCYAGDLSGFPNCLRGGVCCFMV